MKDKKIYIFTTIILFISCILIVVLFSDYHLIRGFIGDVIVIALIYSFIKIFIDIEAFKLCIGILLFATLIECLQYFNLVELIGLSGNKIARIVIGTTFDVKDLVAYTVGAILTYLIERKVLHRSLT